MFGSGEMGGRCGYGVYNYWIRVMEIDVVYMDRNSGEVGGGLKLTIICFFFPLFLGQST